MDWRQVVAEYERHQHAAQWDGSGLWRVRSRVNAWRAEYDGQEMAVLPDGAAWRFPFATTSYGRPRNERSLAAVAPARARVNRIEYVHDGGALVEWFVNDARGVE